MTSDPSAKLGSTLPSTPCRYAARVCVGSHALCKFVILKIVRHVGEHNHEGNAANVEVAKLYGELKRRSADTMEGPAQILQQTTANLSE